MVTILLCIGVIWLISKLLIFGIKAAWGIMKILGAVILLPLFFVGLCVVGLVYIALGLLVLAGIGWLVGRVVMRWQ